MAESGDNRSARVVIIEGGHPLSGRVRIPGNKHGMVLAFAATVALGARLTLYNAPWLTERTALSEAVGGLGGEVSSGAVTRINGLVTESELPAASTGGVHGSLYLIPSVLAQLGQVTFHGSGGDGLGSFEWGLSRPLRHMLEVMECFGARWQRRDGVLRVEAPRPRPATLDIMRWSSDEGRLTGPRVSGATKTALLMASAIPGTSLILNPHEKEAQHELISLLRHLGVEIEQRDGGWLVRGGTPRGAGSYELMPDPVDVLTWQAYAAMTGSSLVLDCGETVRTYTTTHRELRFLKLLGIEPEFRPDAITVRSASGPYNGADLVADSTGISTDIAPLLTLLLLRARSDSMVEDRVWPGRFGYADQLVRMGAAMSRSGSRLIVRPSRLRPPDGPLAPADTRSVAVCIGAALAAHGETTVGGIDHLDRGYQDMVARLRSVGARVESCAEVPG
jgi:UDP-N-acetylglucosamine 1-carboxyvinyltransferase